LIIIVLMYSFLILFIAGSSGPKPVYLGFVITFDNHIDP
jgi:hypothetical protein